MSKSSYSLSDQLKLNPLFNDGDTVITFDDIDEFINKIRNEWKVSNIYNSKEFLTHNYISIYHYD